jgi:hypothetical protein
LVLISSGCADASPTHSQRQTSVSQAKSADAAAQDFYRWYVGLMAKDREPGDDPTAYARLVTKSLRASISRQMAAPDGMEVDYFVKAQDYLDSWVDHVTAGPATMHGDMARTTITLGTKADEWKLLVSMVREDGAWKIAEVTRS